MDPSKHSQIDIDHLRIALIHDAFMELGGAEQVVINIAEIFPHADIYTSMVNPLLDLPQHLRDSLISTWPQSLNRFRYQTLTKFLFMYYWESLNLDNYDLVISSSDSLSCKSVLTRPETLHLCYCHTPPKYLYPEYPKFSQLNRLIPGLRPQLLSSLRRLDYVSAYRPDYFIANSKAVKRRIHKYYRRHSTLIPPPVAIPPTPVSTPKRDHYVLISNLELHKGIDLAIDTFNRLKKRLIIIGSGRYLKHFRSKAPNNIELVGYIDQAKKIDYLKSARALISTTRDEDFGITLVESLGFGTPVIAHQSGGSTDIITPQTGILYRQFTTKALRAALMQSAKKSFDIQLMHRHARQFSTPTFRQSLLQFIMKAYDQFSQQ